MKPANISRIPFWYLGFSGGSDNKESATMQETWARSLGQEDPLEKETETHSSNLTWEIPWTEEPGRLQSMGLQRVGHDWVTSLSLSLVLFRLNWVSNRRDPGFQISKPIISRTEVEKPSYPEVLQGWASHLDAEHCVGSSPDAPAAAWGPVRAGRCFRFLRPPYSFVPF